MSDTCLDCGRPIASTAKEYDEQRPALCGKDADWRDGWEHDPVMMCDELTITRLRAQLERAELIINAARPIRQMACALAVTVGGGSERFVEEFDQALAEYESTRK